MSLVVTIFSQFHPLQEERHVMHNNLKAACQSQSFKFLKQRNLELESCLVYVWPHVVSSGLQILKCNPDQGQGVIFILT